MGSSRLFLRLSKVNQKANPFSNFTWKLHRSLQAGENKKPLNRMVTAISTQKNERGQQAAAAGAWEPGWEEKTFETGVG